MTRRSLADFVTPPEVPSTVLQAEWHEVRRRVQRRRQARRLAALSVTLVLAGVVAGLALRPARETLDVGAAVAGAPQQVWLEEGSSIVTAPQTSLQLVRADATDVRLVVERGEATFDVARIPQRRFVVQADSVEVLVVGTRFTVQRQEREVRVTVERGVVEVRDGAQRVRLTAGQTWARLAEQARSDDEPTPPFEALPPTAPTLEKRAVRRPARREVPQLAEPELTPVTVPMRGHHRSSSHRRATCSPRRCELAQLAAPRPRCRAFSWSASAGRRAPTRR